MTQLVNKCKTCQYQTCETQDWFCPICSNRKSGKYVKMELGVLVND